MNPSLYAFPFFARLASRAATISRAWADFSAAVRPSHRAFPPSLAPRAESQRIAARTLGGTAPDRALGLLAMAGSLPRSYPYLAPGLTYSSGLDRLVSRGTALLPDTEPAEYFTQQIVWSKFTGNGIERPLCKSQLLGQ